MGLRTIKRRRRENKTDYKSRKGLLLSETQRIVVRRTNKYFIVQLVESEEAQDKIIMGITSKELLKKGWNSKNIGSLKSIPAGYLTGLLFAKKIKENKKISKNKLIMDLGMARTISGSRVFSVVKGIVEGGLNISANQKVFPPIERINGDHLKPELKNIINKVKAGI